MSKNSSRKVIITLLMASVILTGCGGPLYKPGMVAEGKGYQGKLDAAKPGHRAGFWTVENGIELYHFEQGQGRKVLIVHGGPGFPPEKPWKGLEPLLAHYQFVYYHQRGCGQSTRPIDRFSSKNFYKNMMELNQSLGLGSQVADIERIRKYLGEEKLILIGHSFGGFIASLYAAEFPDHVEKLVLVTPADVIKMPRKEPGHEGLYTAVREKLDQSKQKEFDAFMKRYFDYKHIFEKSESELEALNNEFAEYYLMVAEKGKKNTTVAGVDPGEGNGWLTSAVFFSMGRKHDYTKALKKITSPTLIVYGSQDMIPETSIEDYRKYIRHHQYRPVPNAGHAVFEDNPQGFSKAVAYFLGKGE